MPERTSSRPCANGLFEEMERDDRICVLGQDVGLKARFKTTEGLSGVLATQRRDGHAIGRIRHRSRRQAPRPRGFGAVAEMQFADYSYLAFTRSSRDRQGSLRRMRLSSCPS